jgi:hypothetical protein
VDAQAAEIRHTLDAAFRDALELLDGLRVLSWPQPDQLVDLINKAGEIQDALLELHRLWAADEAGVLPEGRLDRSQLAAFLDDPRGPGSVAPEARELGKAIEQKRAELAELVVSLREAVLGDGAR